jgi:mono/diheme cytochrome c family protein
MKRLPVIGVLSAVLGTVAYAMLNRLDPAAGAAPGLAGAPASADWLTRGEYLTKAADCIACHTVPDSDKPFAGGVAFRLPFGTIYSSNITADSATGIGGWSDEDFVRAVREGVRQDGQHLYPAFPYTSYTRLSRSDVLAIKAYLFSLPPIRQANRPNELAFPFNQRWAMGFWNAGFFKSRRFAADPSKSAQWNSGAYLATALGHCGECHTPRNLAFGLEHGSELAGEEMQGWRAYNITADPKYGIGSWSDADIAQYLSTGHAEGHGSAFGPMGEAVAHSLQYLSAEDVTALVAYLRSVPAREGRHPIDVDARPAPAMASTEVAPRGETGPAHAQGLQLFAGACASCHQWNGQGEETRYATLLGTRGVNDSSGVNVTQAILQGVSLRIGDSDVFMPAFGAGYSNTEVAALTNFAIAQFGAKQGRVTADDVAKRRAPERRAPELRASERRAQGDTG